MTLDAKMAESNSVSETSQAMASDEPTTKATITTSPNTLPEWKPGRSEWLIFLCLSIISLIVSLDSSIIGPALPVSSKHHVVVVLFLSSQVLPRVHRAYHQTAANVPQAISLSLNGTANETFWAGTSYLVTCAIFQPFIVSLSDAFGRRQLLFVSLSLFTIGTILCCVAQNFPTLLVGRSIQGVGGGGALALVLVIMTDIVPLRQRPKYYALIQLAWASLT